MYDDGTFISGRHMELKFFPMPWISVSLTLRMALVLFPQCLFLSNSWRIPSILVFLILYVPFFSFKINSLVVIRYVRRIPLKLYSQTALDDDEAEHLASSFDGLTHFYPVDIYP